MKQSFFRILENTKLAEGIFRMVLSGDTQSMVAPGQFVNIKVDGHYLRRPFCVCDWDQHTMTLIYQVVGGGTLEMSKLPPGTELDILSGLGNGFCLEKSGAAPLLIGGGSGVPALFCLAKQLLQRGIQPTVLFGFRSAKEQFYVDEFVALGANVQIATEDGSLGTKGLVTDLIASFPEATYIYACGPLAMLQAVSEASATPGEFSLESRMGCGFGACMGCSVQTKHGPKRICKEGPVLTKEEILW